MPWQFFCVMSDRNVIAVVRALVTLADFAFDHCVTESLHSSARIVIFSWTVSGLFFVAAVSAFFFGEVVRVFLSNRGPLL